MTAQLLFRGNVIFFILPLVISPFKTPFTQFVFSTFFSSPMFDLLWLCLELINLHEICTILKQNISCFISCIQLFFYDIRLNLLRCDTYVVRLVHMHIRRLLEFCS